MVEEILKWTLLVIAAGFVGYFGRYFAMELIRRLRGDDLSGGRSEGNSTKEAADVAAKLEKKRLKNEAKSEKKRLKAQQKKEDG
jgi:hypothetical protein